MKYSKRAPLVVVLSALLAMPMPSLADNRVNIYGQSNPISTNFNLMQRNQRLGDGVANWSYFGSNASFGGVFSNLTVAAAGSLNVTVGQANSSFPGVLYGLGVDDSANYPASQPSGATGLSLAADSTQLLLEAVVTAATGSIGVSAGTGSGQSIINLLECKPLIVDQTSQTIDLITSSGGSGGTASVSRDRADTLSCQNKASASSVSPSLPAADSGYTAIGYATVAFGTSTVTSGMITVLPAFNGFSLANVAGATAIDTSSTAQTKAGSLTDSANITAGGNLIYGTGSGGTGGTFTGSTGNFSVTGTGTVGGALNATGNVTSGAQMTANGNVVAGNGGSGEYWQTENGFTVHQSINSGDELGWFNANTSTVVPLTLDLANGQFFFGSSGAENISPFFAWGTNGSYASGNTSAGFYTNHSGTVQGVSSSLWGVTTSGGASTIAQDGLGNTGILGTVHAANVTTPGSVTATGAVNTATGLVSTAGDGAWQLSYPANSGGNMTAIGQNSGNGFPYFSIAKQSSGGSFQSWLLGIDSSLDLVVPNGSINTPNNFNFGSNTLYGSSGNINSAGTLTMGGAGTFGSSLTAGSNITASNGYLSSSTATNAGEVFFGTSGSNKMDFGVTASGATTLPGLTTAGVVTTNAAGTLSPLAPGSSGNLMISNGSVWTAGGPPASIGATCSYTNGTGPCGYTTLAGSGGLLLEWGTTPNFPNESGQVVTIPASFPHAALSYTTTLSINGSPNSNIDQTCQVYSTSSLSTFGIYMQQNGGGAYAYPQQCTWTAIGY